jgi:hypothetical protein
MAAIRDSGRDGFREKMRALLEEKALRSWRGLRPPSEVVRGRRARAHGQRGPERDGRQRRRGPVGRRPVRGWRKLGGGLGRRHAGPGAVEEATLIVRLTARRTRRAGNAGRAIIDALDTGAARETARPQRADRRDQADRQALQDEKIRHEQRG